MWSVMILLASTLMVKASVPDYIQVCSRDDPDINKCIINSAHAIRDKFAVDGIPALDIPAVEPLHFDYVPFDFGPGFRAENRDVVFRGMSKFQFRSVNVNFENYDFSFEVIIPKIHVESTYKLDAKIASIPLKGTGHSTLNATDIVGKGVFHGKVENRKGKKVIWFPSVDFKLQVGSYTINLENLFDGDEKLGESTNRLLNDNPDDILPVAIPAYEKAVSETLIKIANKVVKNFTVDELFPEKKVNAS